MNIGQDLLTDDVQQKIAIPADLLQQIDELLGQDHQTREEFIRAALRHYLQTLNLPSITNASEEYPESK